MVSICVLPTLLRHEMAQCGGAGGTASCRGLGQRPSVPLPLLPSRRRIAQLQAFVVFAGQADGPVVFKEENLTVGGVEGTAGGNTL